MRKDWDRSELRLSDSGAPTMSVTGNMYGGSYMDSPFAKISKEWEQLYFADNIEHQRITTLVDDHSEYLQDGVYAKVESSQVINKIISAEYDREFYEWLDRGHRLWSVYPAATLDSGIVKLWSQEIELIRKEFHERQEAIPF